MPNRLIPGNNDLASQQTPILQQWDYKKNYPLTPKDVTYSSTKKVCWICENGHRWSASVEKRFFSKGQCPICNNQRVIVGVNDLPTTNPEVMLSWDYKKNMVDPHNYSAGSAMSVYWICEKGHSWKTSIHNRIKQEGCPYCKGYKIWPGFNDVKTLYPELIREWDFELNIEDPITIAPASSKKFHWICPQGHHYEASVASRTRLHSGCPYCSNQKLLKGYNDFATVYPQLVKEWDFEKNEGKSPSDYIAQSEAYVWWKCSKGHSWKTMISTRVRKGGTGCPTCAKEYKTSIPEQATKYYCSRYFPDTIGNFHPEWIGKSEIDIFIPSIMTAIEYDGRNWHKSVEKDKNKNNICSAHGIRLIRLREPGIECFNNDCISLVSLKADDLSKGIVSVLHFLNIKDPDVNVSRDIDEIYKMMDYQEKNNSLQNRYPEIASQWDYEKNSEFLSPKTVNCKSKISVYWKCDKGHSYKARIDHRTIMKSGCPICAAKKIVVGINDFASQHPELLFEWDYKSNEKGPEEYTSGSNVNVNWICKNGHKWPASIVQRVHGSGCPYCSGQRAIPGKTDIRTIDPKLIEEWDFEKNDNISPEMFLPHSSKIVWWKCKKGHSWKASIKKRFEQKVRSCPLCKKEEKP